MYELSTKGLAFIKSFEGLRLQAYQDSAGIWTIGYGHTGRDVHKGRVITEPQAEQLLLADMQHAVSVVNAAVTVKLTQSMFDALCDFAYNAKVNAFLHSTLLEDLNRGSYALAAAQFWLRFVLVRLTRKQNKTLGLSE